MKQLKFHTGLACLVVGGMLWAVSAQAQGRIVIQPKISLGGQYNSNFWKTEDNEVGAYTYYAGPGVVIGYETPKLEVAIDGTLDMYWYDDKDTPPPGFRDASDDDYVGATFFGRVNYQATDRLNLGVTDELYITRYAARTLNFVDYEGRTDGNSNAIERDKYLLNHFEPSIYYDLSERLGLLAKYRNTYTDYEKDLEDSNEHRGIFNLYYRLNRSAAVYLDYQTWKRDYSQETIDYSSNMVTLNYEHEFNYFTLRGGGGYHKRSFDQDELDDLDIFSWKFQLRGQDPDSTRQTTRSRILLDFGQELNDDGTNDRYFLASFVSLELGYRLTERIGTTLKFAYQNSDYETEDRDEDTIQGAARIAYQAHEYLTLGVDVGLESRDSNVVGNDYDDTFFMLTLDIDYDLASR
jgi:hypothetical protein